VADVLRDRGVEVTFAGTPNRFEATIVPARGFPFEAFRVSGLDRRVSPRLMRSLGEATAAPVRCGRILRRIRPHAVLGAGGYVAGPMVAAAAALRIPAALTEADSHLGLANRLAAPMARRVLLAFPIPGLDPPRYRVVGRPVEPAFFHTDPTDARRRLGIDAAARVVVIFGGSMGAGTLNAAAGEAYAEEPPPGVTVLHVAGRGKLGGIVPGERYRVFEYTDRMPDLLAAADLVVCRAGGSVFEVAAAGRPAVLVPWSGAAADHQTSNALHFVRAGAALLVPDGELDAARLRRETEALLADPARLAAMAAAMRAAARPHAAADVADELLAMVGGSDAA
jgi:UDP-N-acetylglucosamine--N-acetylmuramyl-(pentapeptide) pyrophosphoryl-undecaprenol N-acetylglucosamine transferase